MKYIFLLLNLCYICLVNTCNNKRYSARHNNVEDEEQRLTQSDSEEEADSVNEDEREYHGNYWSCMASGGSRHRYLRQKVNDSLFQEVVLRLWKADSKRIDDWLVLKEGGKQSGKGPNILNLQKYRVKQNERRDNKLSPLFKQLVQSRLQFDTQKALFELDDAYKSGNETLIDAKAELFLDKINGTGPYMYLYEFLKNLGCRNARNLALFRAGIKALWFTKYNRFQRGSQDLTSAFKHLAYGEIKAEKTNFFILGMHLWSIIWKREHDERLKYNGVVFAAQWPEKTLLPQIQFRIGDAWKKTGTFILGTTPEFDLMLYTFCHLARYNSTVEFFLGDSSCVEVHTRPHFSGQFIHTAYPTAQAKNPDWEIQKMIRDVIRP